MTTAMKSIARSWDKFWFSAATSEHLGRIRVAVFAVLFLLVLGEPFTIRLVTYPASFWHPVWIIATLISAPPGYPLLHWLEILWQVAILTSAVGLMTRVSTFVSAGLGLYFIGLTNSFGVVSHAQTPVILCLFVLALSACGDGFSVDAWIHRTRKKIPPDQARAASGRYHWPIQLLRLIWCLVYFSAGFGKIRAGGISWIFSDNMEVMLSLAPHRYPTAAAASLIRDLGPWLAQASGLCVVLALLSVSLELMAPIALFSTSGAWLLVPLLCGMQIMIYFTMYENFIWFLPLYLAWMPRSVDVLRMRGGIQRKG
jgi:hypothetical protein